MDMTVSGHGSERVPPILFLALCQEMGAPIDPKVPVTLDDAEWAIQGAWDSLCHQEGNPMICSDCKGSADVIDQVISDYMNGSINTDVASELIRSAAELHNLCPGSTHCACQHRVKDFPGDQVR